MDFFFFIFFLGGGMSFFRPLLSVFDSSEHINMYILYIIYIYISFQTHHSTYIPLGRELCVLEEGGLGGWVGGGGVKGRETGF